MENMDAQDYIDAIRAKKRRNLIIGVVIAVILGFFMVPRFLSMFGADTEYLDEDTVLAQAPALALTGAEKELADRILEFDAFRDALTYEATGVTRFEYEDVQDILSPVLPADATVMEIGVQGAVIYMDYQSGARRVILEYVDADRSGTIDRIHKGVASTGQGVYYLQHTVRTGETLYQTGESWFE